MRANVGASSDPAFNQNFDPQFELPAVVTNVTRVDRGYTDSPSATVTKVFDDFPVVPTNTYTTGGIRFTIGPVSQHDASDYEAFATPSPCAFSVVCESRAELLMLLERPCTSWMVL